MNESGYRERNSTADRALTILEMFNDDRLLITAVDVAETLGVARSTAYRYLQTLVKASFLEEEPGSGFRLGVRILQLSRIARRSQGVAELSLPTMRQLAEELHQTVLLTRLSGNSIVCLEREEWQGQYVRLSYERGSLLNINAGASALVLLAWLPEARVRELLAAQPLTRFTDATLVDPDAIVERLATIRSDGFSVTRGEVDPDAMGIAAPIFSGEDKVVGGLSVVVIQSRIDPGTVPSVIDTIVRAAGRLSERVTLHDA
ncbi:transcriptional regulator [Cnuibacter physcomitrellae]|uniref:IclR family transcriptional regulator n=1 Tax=Cnuibacter physcomitrellae TaxID=1619308 RepID=A0A1X9LGB1_9MICO|nr:IclR family transcriptional regulator [Cnuibacter physcomitrellae]ARJ04173.1 IclR family transcriptional regulator [Cnuibacter physcomitrellae]GGI40428.1 transcriptional regulator [Cnuibacter physcomitrellae]